LAKDDWHCGGEYRGGAFGAMKRWWQVVLALVVVLTSTVVTLGVPAWPSPPLRFGVTFSTKQARGLGLDWQEVYRALLQDLGVKKLRLIVYWDEVEPSRNHFDFREVDWQVREAQAAGASVIMTLGRKVPRWPECFEPSWAGSLSELEKQAEIIELIGTVVARYRGSEAVSMWQLENEPLLAFGVCPAFDADFLAREEATLRLLDSRPILITDSGELNSWLGAAAYGDMLGTTMYRTVFSSRTQQLFHYDYLFPAWLYRLKARLVYLLRGHTVLISELQGEPWGRAPIHLLTPEERAASFDAERFEEIARFAQRTQLSEAYWWGVEYWYWEKVVHHNPSFWESARMLFSGV
jgi:hypothetical protein